MNIGLIQIYANEATPRLQYIAGIILGDILGLSWKIESEKQMLTDHPVINYSSEEISGSFKVPKCQLLFEKEVSEKDILVEKWEGLPVFFTHPGNADIPFDIFAASFYLVSRYEEYLPFEPDEHGRFRASSSLSFRNGFLSLPVVDLWAMELGKELMKRFPGLALRLGKFCSIVTIDTDQPFKHLGKSIFRSMGGMIRDAFSGKGKVSERFKVLAQKAGDPFFVYDYITEAIVKSKTESLFFFLVGNHSKHDPNPSWKNNRYRALIKRISMKFKTGVHPSYLSFNSYPVLKDEIKRLESIAEEEITRSRFHFIRFSFPGSFRDLLSAGIREDYSMGYPDHTGFRAGIARPFYFYDVKADQQTRLKLIPFMVMDVTLSQYMNLDPEASAVTVSGILNQVRAVGGMFSSIWHNTNLTDTYEGKGWRKLFESMLQMQL